MATELPILLFAQARDAAGTDRVAIPWAGGDVATLRSALAAQVPGLAPVLPGCRFAVNQTIAHESAPVAAGDEVAVLPPFGGG
ncbi:MAG TPA: MoaD/ThiS family protein [bacterium]|nr:MoaD/ThiS family protein [bacterium]